MDFNRSGFESAASALRNNKHDVGVALVKIQSANFAGGLGENGNLVPAVAWSKFVEHYGNELVAQLDQVGTLVQLALSIADALAGIDDEAAK